MLLKFKKFAGLLLLLVTVTPLLVVTGFLIKQKVIQRRMEERLEYTRLQTVTAPVTAVKWIRANKEVTINGRLFDVKKIRITGNTITLTGLYDTDELVLKKELADLHRQKKEHSVPLHQLVFQFISTPAINEMPGYRAPDALAKATNTYSHYKDNLPTRTIRVITPPPNV